MNIPEFINLDLFSSWHTRRYNTVNIENDYLSDFDNFRIFNSVDNNTLVIQINSEIEKNYILNYLDIESDFVCGVYDIANHPDEQYYLPLLSLSEIVLNSSFGVYIFWAEGVVDNNIGGTEIMSNTLFTGIFAGGDGRYYMRKLIPSTTEDSAVVTWFKNLSKINYVEEDTPGPCEGKCIGVMKSLFYDDTAIPTGDSLIEFVSKLLISKNDDNAEQIRIPYCKADVAATWAEANKATAFSSDFMVGGAAAVDIVQSNQIYQRKPKTGV